MVLKSTTPIKLGRLKWLNILLNAGNEKSYYEANLKAESRFFGCCPPKKFDEDLWNILIDWNSLRGIVAM